MTSTIGLEIRCTYNFKFILLSSGECFQCKIIYINVQQVYKLGFLKSYCHLEQFSKATCMLLLLFNFIFELIV